MQHEKKYLTDMEAATGVLEEVLRQNALSPDRVVRVQYESVQDALGMTDMQLYYVECDLVSCGAVVELRFLDVAEEIDWVLAEDVAGALQKMAS